MNAPMTSTIAVATPTITKHDMSAIIAVYPSAFPISPFAWYSIFTPRMFTSVPLRSKFPGSPV